MPRKRAPLVINGETVELDAPGLKLVPRANGEIHQYWSADNTAVGRQAVKRGYSLRVTRLHHDITTVRGAQELAAHCRKLQDEMLDWLGGGQKRIFYDNTIAGLIRVYREDPDSPYQTLGTGTKVCYDDWCNSLQEVGHRRIPSLTGNDFRKWFIHFMEPKEPGGPPRVRRAKGVVRQMLSILLGYGAEKMLDRCQLLYEVLEKMTLRVPKETLKKWKASKPAKLVMTYEQAEAIVRTALAKGAKRYRSIALGVAAQFEFTLSQIDVVGSWEPISGRTIVPTDIIRHGKVWCPGLCYEHFADGTLDVARSKTDVSAPFDVSAYPLVLEAIEAVPVEERRGPVVVNDDGEPMFKRYYVDLYAEVAREAGVFGVWNARARHGGITEAHHAGADLVDIGKHAQHSNVQTTLKHYIVPDVETTRRVAKKRVAHRKKKPREQNEKTG